MTRLRSVATELVLPILIIGLWWRLSERSHSPYFPPFTRIMADFRSIYIWRTFDSAVLYSLSHFAVGFSVGVTIGFVLGVALGLSSRARRNVAPLTEFCRATPVVALIPIGLVAVGPGMLLEAGLIGLATNWSVLLNTCDGVRGVDPVVIETARSYGLSRWQQVRHIIVPAAMPQVMAGVRVAVGIGVTVMVVANMFANANGLGAQEQAAQVNFQITDSWAGIIMIGLVGIAVTCLYQLAHHRLLRWHTGWRSAAVTRP